MAKPCSPAACSGRGGLPGLAAMHNSQLRCSQAKSAGFETLMCFKGKRRNAVGFSLFSYALGRSLKGPELR